MKYSAVILLVAVAVCWQSVSARKGEDLEDYSVKGLIQKFNEHIARNPMPEPFQSKLLEEVERAKNQHWNSLKEYSEYILSYMQKIVKDAEREKARGRREAEIDAINETLDNEDDSNSNETFEKVTDQKELEEKLRRKYTGDLISVAPSEFKSILEQRFEEIKDKEYENFFDFAEEAENIFSEVTGRDSDSFESL